MPIALVPVCFASCSTAIGDAQGTHYICKRKRFIAEFGDFAVVADFAVADEGLRFAAGTESGVGDDFLEALWFLLGHGSTSVEEGRGCQCCGRVTFVLALARVYNKNR